MTAVMKTKTFWVEHAFGWSAMATWFYWFY